MAKILLGASIGDMRGKQGGTVYSRNRYANYTRNKTIPVNPRTAKQTVVRNLFSSISSGYRSLTQSSRDAWATLAAALAPTNVFGQAFSYTPFNVYQMANQNLGANGLSLLTLPALEPPTFAGLEVTATGIANGEMNYQAAINTTLISPDNRAVQVQATPAVSGNVSNATVQKSYRTITTFAPSTDFDPAIDISDLYAAVFNWTTTVPGQIIYTRTRQIDTETGVASAWVVNVINIS